jgi:hypothetical protein
VAKLLGPQSSGGHKQVSIRRVIADIPIPPMDPRRLEWLARLEAMQHKYEPILDNRNHIIAHKSLAVATGSESVQGISRLMIGEAIEDCVKLTNDILHVFSDSEFGFIDFGDEERDTQTLLRMLAAGNAAIESERRERRARLYGGQSAGHGEADQRDGSGD